MKLFVALMFVVASSCALGGPKGNPCKKEIEKHCKDVPAVKGQVGDCLVKAHKDGKKLGDKCVKSLKKHYPDELK
jgi:hypothetical protein